MEIQNILFYITIAYRKFIPQIKDYQKNSMTLNDNILIKLIKII